MGQIVFWLSGISVLATGALMWGGLRFFQEEFPNVSILRNQYPIVHFQGPLRPVRITLSKTRPNNWAGLGEISRVAVGAIIVSEDWAFYQHRGYDPNQIKEAIKEDWEAGGFVRGASTITQQVVRNVFLDKDKNLWRKLKEVVLAVWIEQTVSKRRILETYLNIAEWGEGVFGIRAAAYHYFQKSPSQLTAKEGAFLAMLLPSPKKYSQSFRAKRLTMYASQTIQSILYKMSQARYITEQERDSALSTPLMFERPRESEL
jgi:monofunctional glycosyltransferase